MTEVDAAIIEAQGRLEPVSGTLMVNAIPGEEIVELRAYVGKRVDKSDVLAVLGSEKIREAEHDLAVKQLVKARKQLASEAILAELQIEVAELGKQQAIARKKEIPSSDAIEVLQERLALAQRQRAKLEELRNNSATRDAITEAELKQQELLVQQIASELKQQQAKLAAATETQLLGERAAELDIAMANKTRQSLQDDSAIKVLEQSVELARLLKEATQVRAPCKGTILEVYAREGERVANTPILQIGDLDRMVCIAEVHEANLRRLEVREVQEGPEAGRLVPAQTYWAMISSPALDKELRGKVVEVGRLIGAPALRDPNPRAGTDIRTAKLRIELDDGSTNTARRFVHLQVNVTISLREHEGRSRE
jgi:HlyD family secretion protein